VQFLGTILGSSQLIDFARDMLGVGLQQARGLVPWPELASACDRSARDLRLAAVGRLGEVRAALKLRWVERSGDAAFVAALAQVGETCEAARAALETVCELAPDFVRLAERAARLAALARRSALPARRGASPSRPKTAGSAGSTSDRSRPGSSSRRSTSARR